MSTGPAGTPRKSELAHSQAAGAVLPAVAHQTRRGNRPAVEGDELWMADGATRWFTMPDDRDEVVTAIRH